jgi:DNA modification methylase
VTRPTALLLGGDARALPLRDNSVQCVVTSPPYWGLRDYGLPPSIWGGDPAHAHAWGDTIQGKTAGGGGNAGMGERLAAIGQRYAATNHQEGQGGKDVDRGALCPCGAWRGVFGLEPTPEGYVAHLVAIFREVRRVLRADGTCWVNLGDSYATGTKGDNREHAQERPRDADGFHSGSGARWHTGTWQVKTGLKPKDLVGIPWRVAFAIQADGWWLRSDIIWSKPNPMPESITDRPTKAHEYLFLLTKSARYFYDAEAIAIKEPVSESDGAAAWRRIFDPAKQGKEGILKANGIKGGNDGQRDPYATGRNRRSVWTIATEPYPEAHFATFPEALVEPCILAGTSARGACPTCGAPWGRVVEHGQAERMGGNGGVTVSHAEGPMNRGGQGQWDEGHMPTVRPTLTRGWSPACACPAADPVPCRVLDELKPAYLALARRRTIQAGLL